MKRESVFLRILMVAATGRPRAFRLVLLALAFCCQAAVGQRKFQYIGAEKGLPDGEITSLITDHRGTLWIGTNAGLARYDGHIATTVADNAVSNIYEDGEHNLWIHSGDTFLRYLRRDHRMDDRTEEFFASIGVDATTKKALVTDSGDRLWVLTERNLYCYDFARRKLRTMAPAKPQWTKAEHISIAEDNRCIYILASPRTVMSSVDKESGATGSIQIPATLIHSRPCVFVDSRGLLWIYSTLSERLYRQSGGAGEWTAVPLPSDGRAPLHGSPNAIRSMADDGKGNLWIATDHRGLFRYDTLGEAVTSHITADANCSDCGEMAENNINTMIFDRHGTLWLGHYKRGISYSSPEFSMFNRLAKDCGDVTTMLTSRDGTLWIGTDGNGLFRSSGGDISRTPLRDMVVASLVEDRRGRIWAGTYNSGLYCLDGGRVVKRYSTDDGSLPTDMSWKIAEDVAGQIWICSAFHPLMRLNPATGRYAYCKNQEGADVFGLSMSQDRTGRLYIGTIYGLCVVDTRAGRATCVYGNRRGDRTFLNQQIMALCHDSRGILWMGHYNGLEAWDTRTDSLWTFTAGKHSISNNLVKSIREDAQGNVWVSTAGGISRISVADRQTGDFNVHNFRHVVNESNNYFNNNSSTLAADGTVLFGCVNGYVAIRPQNYQATASAPPQVFFSSITVGGLPIDETAGEINLSYSDHTIELRLMTDNPAGAPATAYAYAIGGNNEWICTNSPVISFASLAPGTYVIRVKACNGDGVWSGERSLTINVAPPLWRSPLMFCLYAVLIVAGAAVFVVGSRRRTARRLHRERRQMEQEKNVRLAEMKLRFFTNVSHDLRTPLTLIISPLQTLLREELPDGITRRLQIMEKNARLLQEQINTLLDFRRLDVGAERLQLQPGDIAVFVRDECGQFSSYAADRCISFSFESDVESLPAKFDSDKIHKIIYNLLSNAFKYTPDGKSVAVSLRRTEGGVELNVADSGPGVADGDKQLIFERFYQSAAHASVSGSQHLTGSGIGLHIVSEYVRLMGGTIGVSDGPEGGAVFTCYIPVAETAGQGAAELVYDGACGASDAFTVLVVDDNQDMCEFIGTSLSDRYRVLTASDGEAALGVLRRETVSLVVSDVMMPVMDGLELCRRIKSDLQLSHIPVILLTAKTAEGSVMEGYEAGADDYMVKPFNIDMLKLRINKFIEQAKMSHRQFRLEVDVAPDEITSTPLDEQFLKRAIEIVERHISDSDFSVEALGQELAMNRVALWKKLQAITGKGPADFIRSIRVKRGLRLLDAGEMNVSEIAYAVGYNTVKRFTENFKAEFGITPSEYKKRNAKR